MNPLDGLYKALFGPSYIQQPFSLGLEGFGLAEFAAGMAGAGQLPNRRWGEPTPEPKEVKHVESKVIKSTPIDDPLPQSRHLLYGGGCEE